MYHLETGFECEGCGAYVADGSGVAFPYCMSCHMKENSLCQCKLRPMGSNELNMCEPCLMEEDRKWHEENGYDF